MEQQMKKLPVLDPPCDQCNAACCQYKYGEYAVHLAEDEDYPEAVQFEEHPNVFIKVIPYRDGKCVYLEGNRCSIYENRPFLCRQFNCRLLSRRCGFMEENPQLLKMLEDTA